MVVVRQLLDYARLNVPSEEVDTQARELLSVLEEQEAKKSKLEKGEEAWGRLPGKGGGGFGGKSHQGILQSFGLKPGLDSSQVRCPTVRRGLGILWYGKALCDRQSWGSSPHPGSFQAASTKAHLLLPLGCATTPEPPVQDASGM